MQRGVESVSFRLVSSADADYTNCDAYGEGPRWREAVVLVLVARVFTYGRQAEGWVQSPRPRITRSDAMGESPLVLPPSERMHRRLQAMAAVLEDMPQAVGELLDREPKGFILGSPASRELAEVGASEPLETSYSAGSLALTNAADHMFALRRVLTEPIPTFAPWTLTRAVLEMVSLCAWCCEAGLSGRDRIARGLSLRLRNMEDYATFARTGALGKLTTEEGDQALQHRERRVAQMLATADRLGIQVRRDRRGRPAGFGAGLPPSTDLAAAFGEGGTYRMLSGVAHGRHWATFSLALERLPSEKAVTQAFTVDAWFLLTTWCFRWFARAAAAYFRLRGLDIGKLFTLLDDFADQLRLDVRDWR